MAEEVRMCKQGHKMKAVIGRDGKGHWVCNKCRNQAARRRRARYGSAGRGRRSGMFCSSVGLAINTSYYDPQEDDRDTD